MPRLVIPKSPSRRSKSSKGRDFFVPDRDPSGIPSLRRGILSSVKKPKPPTLLPKKIFETMQPSLQSAFGQVAKVDLISKSGILPEKTKFKPSPEPTLLSELI